MLGEGNYEYALVKTGASDRNYQSESFFERLSPDFYTLYVRDMFCGETALDIAIIGFPKFFTPNGDGQNDVWQIRGYSNTNTIIHIFNRYGKLLKTLTTGSLGWDGSYNGNTLPSSDYWFTIVFENGKKYSNHFTLKR